MDESRKRVWDVRLGILAPIITIGGILLGVLQFNQSADDRREEAALSEQQRDTLEFQRRLWQQKLETYQNVAELAGTIVATRGEEQKKAYEKFQAAYWGAMVLVEDRDVEQAMIAFDREYRDLANGWTKDSDRLKVRAQILSEACRRSLATRSLEEPGQPEA